MGDSRSVREGPSIAQEILNYLLDHPDAEDSLEGVVNWWLQEQVIRYRTTEAKAALNCLVKKGFVIEKRTEGQLTVYRLNPEKAQKVWEIIDKDKSRPKVRWTSD